MNAYTKSVSLAIPVANLADVDKIMVWLGRGPGNFSVPLSPTGALPATHYGCHLYDDDLYNIITTRTLPSNLVFSTLGLSRNRVNAVLSSILVKAVPDTNGPANFAALLAENGLQQVVTVDPNNPYG